MRSLFSYLAVAVALLSPILHVNAQEPVASITEAEIRDHMFYLSSDALQGRNTGEVGYDIAAQYAASQFLASNVAAIVRGSGGEPGYLQPVPLGRFSFGSGNRASLSSSGGGSALEFRTDYFVMFNSSFDGEEISGDLVFVGYGLEDSGSGWNDLEGLDISSSIPVMMFGMPGEELTSAFSGQGGGNPWNAFQDKLLALEAKGATAAVAVMDPGTMANWSRFVPFFAGDQLGVGEPSPRTQFPEVDIPVVFISAGTVDQLFSGRGFNPLSMEGEYSTFPLDGASLEVVVQSNTETVISPNVVGFVEGTDPVLKNEYVVVGAHLDHLGVRNGEVYNGADDNASGSVGVLEVAEAMAMAPPKRSVLFVLYTGEEKGLLGSRYFVENAPVAQEQIVANVNIEMIGRWSHRPLGSGQIFAIIGSSDDGYLLETLTRVNQRGFDYDLDVAEQFVGGSDHMAFNAVEIPNITLAGSPPGGTHEDYHGPGDEVEKIDMGALRKAAALIYGVTLELAGGR